MAKKKIKKLLKKALPAIALGLGAAALANRKKSGMSMPDNRDTRKTLLPKKDFMNIGGKAATKVDYFASPRERAGIVKNLGFDTSKKNFGLPEPKFNPTMMLDSGLADGDFAAKDGGRDKKPKKKRIQIQGFGKARR